MEIAQQVFHDAKVDENLEECERMEVVDDDGEDYTEPGTIVPPATLKELTRRLHKVFAQDKINIDYVRTLMESYKSSPKEWKRYAKFDRHRYTRNLVDEGNGKFNLMILCWNEAQGSSIHSHAGSHCFLKVMDGEAKEDKFDWPEHVRTSHQVTGSTEIEQHEDQFHEMKAKEENVFCKNQCAYICDDLGLHRVENPSHVNKAVTLHLYSPPFDECYTFDQRTGKPNIAKVTFWSKFGRRTPFGKNPELKVETENN